MVARFIYLGDSLSIVLSYKINKGLYMGRQRLGGADNQLRMCRVLSHLSSLQKHLSIHTQLTPTRSPLLPSFSSCSFSLLFSCSFQSSWLQGRDGQKKQRARAFNNWRRPGGQGCRRQQQNHQHCSLKVKAACTLPFRQEPPPSLNQIGGASVKTRGKHGGWTRQK